MSPVTYYLSLMPTGTATDHSLANSPTIHSKLVCKDPKNKKILINQKKSQIQKIKLTRGLQSTRKCGPQEGTIYNIQHTKYNIQHITD